MASKTKACFDEALCAFNLRPSEGVIEPSPCLKSLHTDLFKGRKIVTTDEKNRDRTVKNAPIFECALPSKDFVFDFFPIFDEDNATYRSRFFLKNTLNNGWGTRLCDALLRNPEPLIKDIEDSCRTFLKKNDHDPTTLHQYLYSRLRIVIDNLGSINRYWCESKGEEEHQTVLLHMLEKISLQTPVLFARLLVVAGLRIPDITFNNLKLLLDDSQKHHQTVSCDASYLHYLECRQSDPQQAFSFIQKAYEDRQREALFGKEILSEYAMELMASDDEYDKKQAVKVLNELTSEFPSCSKGFYLLAECHKNGCGCEKDDLQAADYLKRAANADDLTTMLSIALRARNDALGGKDSRAAQRIKDCCTLIIDADSKKSSSAYCRAAYLLGELFESIGNEKESALKYYHLASEAGYAPASAKVALYERKKRVVDQEVFTVQNTDGCAFHCFVSGDDQVVSTVVAEELRKNRELNVYVDQRNEKSIYERTTPAALLQRLYSQKGVKQFPAQLTFAFLERNTDKNLNDALHLLDSLYNLTVDMENESAELYPEKKDRLTESVEICLLAPYEHAAMMIDASLCDMGGGLYFKVRILDENKDCAHRLLFDAPLFIPCIRSKDHAPSVVAFGNTPFIYEFVKEATACCYMPDHKVQIAAVGEGINKKKMKMMQEAPGLFAELPKDKITPAFFDLPLDHPALPDALSGKLDASAPESIKALAASIQGGNYFVVDVGSDTENIAFARNLRSWLLKNDPSFSRLPFIAVHCKDAQNAYLARRLTVGSMGKGERWFNNYDLYCFGSANDLYASILGGEITEDLALSAHLYHYGFDDSRSALADYYLHSYSRDSSLATALGLIYRMFNSGIFEEDWRLYDGADPRRLLELAKRFDDKLATGSSEEQDRLAAAEQARWNCFMLSRGWLCPTSRQVLAYMNESKDLSHKQELCKYHPYISDWNELSDKSDSSFSYLKSQIVQKTLVSPRESTIKAVKDTLSLFVYLNDAAKKREEKQKRSN